MPDTPGATGDLRIVQARVYYDPDSGDIVHIHKLAVPAGETLDGERIEDEMSVFDKSIEKRHGRTLESVDVAPDSFDEAMGKNMAFRIDLETRKVIREDFSGPE